jgi:FkbM family methyltransferase
LSDGDTSLKARFLYRAFKARYRDQGPEIAAVLAALGPGAVAVDVGANKGAYLYWMRRAVGATGQVLAFEPQARLAGYLRSVAVRMRWSNVVVEDCALSDSAGIRMLHVPGASDSPGASLEEAILASSACREEAVSVDTLDRRLESAGKVALIKVDVEGHELAVFRGAVRTLTESRPVLVFECEARHLTKHTPRDVFAFLEGMGYGGAFFSPGGLRPVAEFDEALHQRPGPGRFWKAPGYCNNFLFTASVPAKTAAGGRPGSASGLPGTPS